ncbi:Alpha/beta hydrolase fold family protein [Paraburkholderia piptadeniae]|uniref:Alpha/beta hydrolase fold family protein n=1 Tax=Paraburkholderia piptadeniae TaxID=1701573 RepID=A0A1N7SPN3_9BURK|nr:thioesterase domain-containing protein [Paraburkholderia piptadeniae]SIT49385.1 Alpha/beta hydrolase fold family protein [Paraburkholderia piptadeniae]
MNDALAETTRSTFDGLAGTIEALIDAPASGQAGIALIAHPHPLEGGTAQHKIPLALARLFQKRNWLALRPNFRGIGGTAGTHDGGDGETDDLLSIVATLRSTHPELPVALAGFSFGAYVQARVTRALVDRGAPPVCTVLAGLPYGTVAAGRHYDTPAVPSDALIIHGELDAIAPLSATLDWARPQKLPVVVIPGANHFLTGHLGTLVGLVDRHIATLK